MEEKKERKKPGPKPKNKAQESDTIKEMVEEGKVPLLSTTSKYKAKCNELADAFMKAKAANDSESMKKIETERREMSYKINPTNEKVDELKSKFEEASKRRDKYAMYNYRKQLSDLKRGT